VEILGVGPGELLLVFLLALIFIGPRRMPEVASQLGKAIREFQKASAELTQAISAEIEAAEAEKAALQAAQEAVLTTTATTDIISEAEEIAARAEREYMAPDGSVPSEATASTSVLDEQPDEPSSSAEQPAPAPIVAPPPALPGMETLPLSLLTASNASTTELLATLLPAEAETDAAAMPDTPPAEAIPSSGQAIVPGMPMLPEALLTPSAARLETIRPAFAASYLGLGMPMMRRRPSPVAVIPPPFDPLPEALLVPSTGVTRG